MASGYFRKLIKVTLLFVSMLLVFVAVRGLSNLNFGASEEPVTIDIPGGYSTDQIGAALKESGIIDSAFWFKVKTKLGGYASQMKAGTYSFEVKTPTSSAIQKLVNGDVAVYNDVRVTIPEGFKISEIATLLEGNFFFTAEEFLESLSTYESEFAWIVEIPQGSLQKYEGYLFPDTYDFQENSQPQAIIKRMLENFNKKIYEPYLASGLQEMYSFHELVTLASIVEKEAIAKEEQNIVASVFLNRLDVNMGLESCATVQYILPVHREILLTEDTKIDSPYNTYLYAGLPPGPISSFGSDAFEAVLEPADTNYFYFHSIGTDGGTHVFSRTLREHINSINSNK